MNKYKCYSCFEIFEEPVEDGDYLCCPHCGDEAQPFRGEEPEDVPDWYLDRKPGIDY